MQRMNQGITQNRRFCLLNRFNTTRYLHTINYLSTKKANYDYFLSL